MTHEIVASQVFGTRIIVENSGDGRETGCEPGPGMGIRKLGTDTGEIEYRDAGNGSGSGKEYSTE